LEALPGGDAGTLAAAAGILYLPFTARARRYGLVSHQRYTIPESIVKGSTPQGGRAPAMDAATTEDRGGAPRPAARPLDPAKREAILCAAHELFLKDGYSQASMDEVARAAGVGKMTVYRHFGNKETLFEGMLRAVCDGMLARASEAPDGGLEDALRRTAWAFVDLITPPDRVGVYRLVVAEAERFPEMARRFHEAAVRRVIDHLAGRIRAFAPEVAPDQAAWIAAMCIDMAKGPAYMRLVLGTAPEPWNAGFAPQVDAAVAWALDRVAQSRAARG